MIPVKLTLKNFMSYGEQPVTLLLEGLHVACLSGDNGNGKSALLDAMTWALWGRTRASSVKSVAEDDIIRLGADEAEVRFEFELDKARYRVVRKRRRGRPGGQWELTQSDGAGAFTPVGGGGMRETERQIARLLHMEYETFLNSAYLQQGRADEFTRQTPDNRKRILAEILGLERYDFLEGLAREIARDRKQEADELDGQVRLLGSEVAAREGYLKELEQTRVVLAQAEEEAANQRKRAGELRDRFIQLDALAHHLTETQARHKRQQEAIAARENERKRQADKLSAIQRTLEQRAAILSDYDSWQTALKRRNQLEPEIEAFNRATQELRSVIGAIELEEKELRSDLRLREEQCKAIEARSREKERAETQIASLKADLRGQAELETALAAAQEETEAAKERVADLRARYDSLKTEIEEIDEVLDLLSHPQAACPVCQSDLSGKRQEAVLARQQKRRAELCQEQAEVKQEGRAQKQTLDKSQESLQDLNKTRDELMVKRSDLERWTHRRDELLAQGVDANQARQEIEALRSQLEQGRFAAPRRAHRKKLEADIERLSLVKMEYAAARETVMRLEPTRSRYEELRHAEGNQAQEAETLTQLETSVKTLRQEAEAELEKINDLRAKLGQYGALKEEMETAEAQSKRLQDVVTQRRIVVSRLESHVEQCDRAEEDRKRRLAEHKRVAEERRIYEDLAAAFGKKGIQAYIIDSVIPELEEEANSLLARMTDNGMQVNFETTRTAKSTRSEIETLDIKITDDAGTRPYELFSGGEGFRINFAIRVALSRLLARRSGAKLQTLILDEGFGSQDGKGREKLIEVIDTIKDDFEKILVITHVDELKDSFTQRIEITKDANGSRIHLI